VLELQSGPHIFVARLYTAGGPGPSVPVGGQLAVTGVYAGRGGNRTAGRDIDSFELLLNSPADIRVLARPSWWTLGHMMSISGVLAGVLGLAFAWIAQLRRRVKERTVQLERQIQERHRAEQCSALERERTRIARDIHDDLGASLTRVAVLSELVKADRDLPEEVMSHASEIGAAAQEAVQGVDRIVWAVNPRNDNLDSLLLYISHYANEFFEPTQIACHLDMPQDLPPIPLTAEVRHNLFMLVKEALNNVLKHAAATEARVQVRLADGTLEIAVADNGRGFDPGGEAAGGQHSGLENMRQRIEAIGGSLRLEAGAGRGTVVRLRLPGCGPQ
jgi:signal transduction histidine kinase